MAKLYDAIASAIKSAADSTGDLIKVMLGTTGSFMEYPTGVFSQFKKTVDTGQLWNTAESFLPHVLTKVGAEMDKAVACWGVVVTQATGVSPGFQKSSRMASVSKNETTDVLTVVFDEDYLTANDYVVHALIETPNGGYTAHVTNRQDGQVGVYFHNGSATLDINSKVVNILVVGYQ